MTGYSYITSNNLENRQGYQFSKFEGARFLEEYAGARRKVMARLEAALKEKLAIGWFFMERKDHRAASESFTEALKIDPANVEAQAALRLARYASQHQDDEVLPSSPPATGDGRIKRPQ